VVNFVQTLAKPATMYNLTVAQAHTYYVGDGQWLVHNQQLLPCAPKSTKWTSTDPYVAEIANAIEDLYPGLVVQPNKKIGPNGSLGEFDIELKNAIIQVKSGKATGLAGQVEHRTITLTRLPVIGFAPDLHSSVTSFVRPDGKVVYVLPALLNRVNRVGGIAATDIHDLLQLIKP
jgi:hypothetical protein